MKLLMGNEAIALGAIRAGVKVVTGYPGTPSTEILETVVKYNDGSIYAEWSVNEKSALEVAAGAAFAGARTMVTMKQVGLNVASDPLMSLNYIGIKGGIVVVVADDPGPISSQTEQDTRHFGKFAKLAVFDPSTPEEAYLMIADAFEYSERYGRPVIFRPTTRVCHSYASVEELPRLPVKEPEGFVKDGKRVIFPKLSYASHIEIEKELKSISFELASYKYNINTADGDTSKKGIAAGGVSWAYLNEALDGVSAKCRLLKISAYPFPKKLAADFLHGLDEVLVLEELDPVIENELITLCGELNINILIKGKLDGTIPVAGENNIDFIINTVRVFLGESEIWEKTSAMPAPPLPVRPPVLCAGCPHRASFLAVKEAAKGKKAVFSGDIGCYTLGNAPPLDMVDTCLCMGAGITIAQGLNRIERDTLNFAFIGDSTFFHTGIAGLINAVYNDANIIIVILDNATTAMTGGQPHPGTGKTVSGDISKKISIKKIIEAIGVSKLVCVNPFDFNAAKSAVKSVMDKKGVRVILFEAPCVAVSKADGVCSVESEKCVGCKICVSKTGCPAIKMNGDKAFVEAALCTGCGLCAQLCAFKAIMQPDCKEVLN